MNIQKFRGKQFFANKMHSEMFLVVFFASFIPMLITAVSLFYLIFSVTAEQVGIPEAIAAQIIPAAHKVAIMLLLALPATFIFILIMGFGYIWSMKDPIRNKLYILIGGLGKLAAVLLWTISYLQGFGSVLLLIASFNDTVLGILFVAYYLHYRKE